MAAMNMLAALRGSKLGLRAHLCVFGLAIVVPVLLFSAFLLHWYSQSVRTANERRALSIARALNADVDREITAITTTLETLATSDALAIKDFRSFHIQAQEALRSRPWHVVLIDQSRRQLVNTRLPWGTALPVSAETEPDLPRIARETKQPYVSDLFVDAVGKRPMFSVSVPVQIGKSIPYALAMSLEPERLVEIITGESLPAGWLAAIADRQNINMARSRLAREFLGRPIPEESQRQYEGRTEGVIRTTDFEGQPSLQAFHYSRLTGWRMAAWAPLSLVEGQLRQAWALFFWSGVALLSLSVLLALGVGRLMARPIGELMRAGAALGAGKPVLPFTSTLREADELSLVLSKAALELDARMGAQAHLAAIVASSPSAVVSLSPDGIIRSWNPAAVSMFGYRPEEAIGRPVDILCPDQAARKAFDDVYARVRRGEVVHADVLRRHKDGHLIDASINVAPMYDEAGRLVGISSINRDIAERKARERHIEFLMRELAHRSKNLLAVVQAIASQTVRYSCSLEGFQERFTERIAAMSRTQDLLVARDWQGTSITELVDAQLAPFAEAASQRIVRGGPEVEFKASVVQSITLALHELATNAAKYGALSVPDGRVAVAWEVTGHDGERRLRMSWRESNGPPVAPPVRKGFGHIVISEMVASAVRGQVTLDYAPAGLAWSIDMPAAAALREAPERPG